jgi:hypothetical protein
MLALMLVEDGDLGGRPCRRRGRLLFNGLPA